MEAVQSIINYEKIKQRQNKAQQMDMFKANVKQTIKSETRQAEKSSLSSAQDRDTSKVTTLAVRSVASLYGAAEALNAGSVLRKYESARMSLDVRLSDLQNDGTIGQIQNLAKAWNIPEMPVVSVNSGGLNEAIVVTSAQEHIQAYDAFIRVGKQCGKTEFVGVAEDIKKRYKNVNDLLQKYEHLQASKPKRLARPMRLLFTPIKSSEGGQAFIMGEQIAMPVAAIMKTLSYAPANIAMDARIIFEREKAIRSLMKQKPDISRNVAKRTVRTLKTAETNVAKSLGLNAKDIRTVGARGLFKKNPVMTALKNHIKSKYYGAMSRVASEKAMELMATYGKGSILAPKAMARANSLAAKAAFHEGTLSRDGLKVAQREVRYALRKGRPVGDAINKAVDHRAAKQLKRKTFFKKANAKIAKKIGSTHFGKALQGLGRFGKIIKGAMEALASALGTAASFLGGILLAALILFLLLGILSMIYFQLKDVDTVSSRYSTTDIDQWETYTSNLMKMLQDKHESYVAKIESTAANYPTADIQYPSGAQENYKEIIAAVMIETQYEPTTFTYEEIESVAEDIYERTHKIKVCDYTYYNADGTEGTATHIFVNILRNDTVCYEAFQDVDVISSTSDAGGVYCSIAVEAAPDDWLSVIKAVKQAVASSGTPYSQTNYITVTVNGETFTMRPDCSGFVSTCLALYSGCTSSSIVNGIANPLYSTASMQGVDIDGFQTFKWSGWSTLSPGDIIVTEGKGHTEIFAYSGGGANYVWNCGSNASVSSAGPTVSGRSSYGWVYRPNSAGSGSSSESEEEVTKAYVGTLEWDPSSVATGMSNTEGVQWDEETESEVGSSYALKATIKEAMSSNLFTSSTYASKNTDHAVGSGVTHATSSSDFIRYILTQHGVGLAFNDIDMIYGGESIALLPDYAGGVDGARCDFQVGDVIFYMPNNSDSNTLKKALINESYRRFDETMSARTVTIDGEEVTYGTVISENVVPMIYDGEKWVYYGRAVDGSDNSGAIRTYQTSDLEYARVLNVIRPVGYTVDTVYGATTYFEGWTDYHIAEFVELINDDCWDTGEKVIEMSDLSGGTINVTGANSSSGRTDIESIDYSWYSEDIFTGGLVFWNDINGNNNLGEGYTTRVYGDLENFFIRNYDRLGILPSVGTSYVYAVTNGRSTEESLVYNNIFEIEKEDVDIDKYTYDDEGSVTVDSVEYKKFKNYYECAKYWLNGSDSSITNPSRYFSAIDSGTAFSAQYKLLKAAGLIKSGSIEVDGGYGVTYADITSAYYNANKEALQEADRVAKERMELLTDLKKATANWKSYYKGSPYLNTDEPANYKGTEEEYQKMYETAEALRDAIEAVKEFDATYQYVTETEFSNLTDAIKQLEAADARLKSAKIAHAQTCEGHTKSYGDSDYDTSLGHCHYDSIYKNEAKGTYKNCGFWAKDENGKYIMVSGYGKWHLDSDGNAYYERDSETAYKHRVPYFVTDASGEVVLSNGHKQVAEKSFEAVRVWDSYTVYCTGTDGGTTEDASLRGDCAYADKRYDNNTYGDLLSQYKDLGVSTLSSWVSDAESHVSDSAYIE